MEINKQLFEDVLSGKLKGIFVLRNGETYSSTDLNRNYNKFKFTHPYVIAYGSYTQKGVFHIDDTTSPFDIINFIPDKNMKENELIIEIPIGYEVDKNKSTFEKIVFKKKDIKPRSWEEYCNNFKGHYYYIQDDRNNIAVSYTTNGFISEYKNILPSKELAEAFLAMMQLMSLRQEWIGDWKPDWIDTKQCKYCIVADGNILSTELFCGRSHPLSFPTKEMAKDFMNCFKDLLNEAKPLI